ncbi:protein kinase, partial [Kocuria sp. KH4]
MDDATPAPGGRPPGSRPVPATARERLAAAVRDDAREPGPRPAEEPLPQLPPEEGLEPVRRLGDGAWLVRETRSREVFVLRPCTGADDAERAASRRALLALAVDLAGREDPRLVAVRGLLGPAAEPVGLVEEYLPDGSLAQRLAERGPLAADEAAAVLRDAAAGLAALHGLGRCHGELTARQILFRRAATGGGPGSAAGPVAGPEGGAGGSGGTARAVVRPGTGDGSPPEDVRALGVVGWTALTGRAPAAGRHRAPLARLRPDVPAPLRRAVESALAEHPADRPGAAQLAAARELLPAPGPAAAGRSSRPAGPGPPPAPSTRRTARGP